MSFVVALSTNAEKDIASIVEYISRDNPRRARDFVGELRARFDAKLSNHPLSGTVIGAYRYTVFGNYVIVYSVDEAAKSVAIVLVTEGHRDWRRIFDV